MMFQANKQQPERIHTHTHTHTHTHARTQCLSALGTNLVGCLEAAEDDELAAATLLLLLLALDSCAETGRDALAAKRWELRSLVQQTARDIRSADKQERRRKKAGFCNTTQRSLVSPSVFQADRQSNTHTQTHAINTSAQATNTSTHRHRHTRHKHKHTQTHKNGSLTHGDG